MRIVELKVLNFIRWICRMGSTSLEHKQMEANFSCLGWLTLALEFVLKHCALNRITVMKVRRRDW